MDELLYQARYFVEHQILPKDFYQEKMKFIYVMMKGKDYIYDVMSDILESQGGKIPYSKDQFDVKLAKAKEDEDDKDYVLVIDFPFPEAEPLCYRAIALFDMDEEKNISFTEARYFTIERSVDETYPPLLCAWNRDGSHSNYGEVSDNIIEQIETALNIYYGK